MWRRLGVLTCGAAFAAAFPAWALQGPSDAQPAVIRAHGEGPPLVLSPPPPPKPMSKDAGDCVWDRMGSASRKAIVAVLATGAEMEKAADVLLADSAFEQAAKRCNVDFETNTAVAVSLTMGAVMGNASLEILEAKGFDRARLQRGWDAAPAQDRAAVETAAGQIMRREKLSPRGDLSGLLTQAGVGPPKTPEDELLVRQLLLYYLMGALEAEAIKAAR